MAKAKAQPASKPITINKKLREAYSWLDQLSIGVQKSAVAKRREQERTTGKKLSAEELKQVADELETIQRKINPDLERMELLKTQLKAHWGHTGVTEIESNLGKTLVAPKFSLAADPHPIQQAVSRYVWTHRLSERVLKPAALLARAEQDVMLRRLMAKVLSVSKLELTVTPPSSRRPRSGKAQEQDEDE